MDSPNDYQKFADECLRLAKQASNPDHKAILEQMADVWLRLASDAKRRNSSSAV